MERKRKVAADRTRLRSEVDSLGRRLEELSNATARAIEEISAVLESEKRLPVDARNRLAVVKGSLQATNSSISFELRVDPPDPKTAKPLAIYVKSVALCALLGIGNGYLEEIGADIHEMTNTRAAVQQVIGAAHRVVSHGNEQGVLPLYVAEFEHGAVIVLDPQNGYATFDADSAEKGARVFTFDPYSIGALVEPPTSFDVYRSTSQALAMRPHFDGKEGLVEHRRSLKEPEGVSVLSKLLPEFSVGQKLTFRPYFKFDGNGNVELISESPDLSIELK